MTNKRENLQHGQRVEEQPDRVSVRLEKEVREIEIDLMPPRLIRIVGRKSEGGSIERHIKITEKEKMLMV